MRLFVLSAALLFASPLRAQDEPLGVLRHTPRDTASPEHVVTVMFDRPVAGGLDRTVDATRIFRIEPAVEGSVGWRDPATLRFVPKDPLVPGTRFRVTVDTGVRGIDGSRLSRPYQFAFRVRGTRLLAHSLGYGHSSIPVTLPLDGRLQLLYSAPVDLDVLKEQPAPASASSSGGHQTHLLRCARGRDTFQAAGET